MDCGAYRGVKLLEHAMKIVERVLEDSVRELITMDDMQFGFMPGKGATHALFILRRMPEEFRGREKKLWSQSVLWTGNRHLIGYRKNDGMGLRKKGLAEVLVQAVMSLYEGSRTKVRVGSGTSDEFGVRVGVHQGSVLSPLIFAIAVVVVTERAKEGLIIKLNFVRRWSELMSENLEDLRERFQRWRSALEGKGLNVNVGKTKIMVSGTEGEIALSKVDFCGICGKRVGSNAVCCTQCTKRIHGRCRKLIKVTRSSARHFVGRRCRDVGNDTKEPVEVLCDEVETVKGFCYLGDKLNDSGGCKTSVTLRVRIGWMNFRGCEELLRWRRFSLRMKGMVYRTCVRSAMLYGSETRCSRESEMAILRRTERAMVRSMCGVKLVDRKNVEELMEMLSLKETLDRMVPDTENGFTVGNRHNQLVARQ